MLRAILHKFWHKEDKEKEASAMAAKSKTSKKSAKKPTKAKATSKAVVKAKAKPAAKKTVKKPAPVKKAASTKKATTVKASAPKKSVSKTTSKKATTKKPVAKKAAATTKVKASPVKKAVTKKSPTKKPAAKKSTSKAKKGSTSRLIGGISPYLERKGESYMSDEQKKHFQELLNTWKSELMEEVDRTVTHMKDEAANFPDPADRATQEEEFSLELRTRDRERKLIKKIDSTLELLEQDDYGYCEACGIEIGVRRLEARPTATQCIDCKTLAEIKERQTGT